MGAIKFTDDFPSLKFKDDHPTIKFFDDGGGWPTLKFRDDHPTLKFFDEGGGPTNRTLDDPNTIYETLVEGPQTAAENIDEWQQWGELFNPPVYGAQPFVLANPHHSMEWTKTFGDPNDPQVQLKQYEVHLEQLEQAKKQLTEQLAQLEEYQEKISREYHELKNK